MTPQLLASIEATTGPGAPPDHGTAYTSTLALTFDRPVGAGWAVPVALAGGGTLVALAGALWLRLIRSE